MAIDASIYNQLGVGVTPLMNPLDIQARKIAIRNALAGGQMQDLQLQQAQQALTNQKSVDNFFSNRGAINSAPPMAAPAPAPAPAAGGALPFDPVTGMNPDPTGGAPAAPAPAAAAPAAAAPQRPKMPSLDDLLNAGVSYSAALPVYQSLQKVDETTATIDKTRADASRANSETAAAMQEYMSEAASAAVKSGMNPAVVSGLLDHFGSIAPEYQAQANLVRAKLASMPPDDQLAYMTAIANQSPKRTEADAKASEAATAATRLQLETPKFVADGTLATLTAAGKAPIQPADQARLDQEAKNIAERARHNRVDENNAALNRESVQLTPQARDQMATMFATTGQLPNLGMGAAVARTRSSIINRAAELFPNVALASNAAAYQANKHSLNTVTGTLDTLSAFENAGLKNLKMFTDAAAKIPDTGVPWLNTPVRMLDEKLVGSANMSVVNAAREIGLREIARVTNDPKLSGVLSDSARHEVQGFSPANATLPQILAVSKILQQDMANVHQSLQEQKEAISNRIGTEPNATPATSAPAYKVGDSVMYNGAPHKVTAVKPDGKLVLAN